MTTFLPLAFESLNETDVREEVIAPLIRALGYRSGTEFNAIREQPLRYPKSYLGRKNPAKDPELRGKADYVLEVRSLIRWVIEAKAPYVDIDRDAIEQAWSYASHPEVRAVYFALCNGKQFQLFQTNHAPDVAPILSLGYDELNHCLPQLAGVVGPDALLRNFPRQECDMRPPIGIGLRSICRITSGMLRHDYNSLKQRALEELQYQIPYGSVERDETGGLAAFLKFQVPIRTIQELNEKLGINEFDMHSKDSVLSSDPANPTCFTYERAVTFPSGEKMLDLTTWQEIVLPFNMHCSVSATAIGALSGNVFSGRFVTKMTVQEAPNLVVEMGGPFVVFLA